MLKKTIHIFLSIFFFFTSCKINKIDKDLVTLNVSIKGRIPLKENEFLSGASTFHFFPNRQVPSSIKLKVPKGAYGCASEWYGPDAFRCYFYLSKEENSILEGIEKSTLEKEARDFPGSIRVPEDDIPPTICDSLDDLKNLENKVFQKIFWKWDSNRVNKPSPEEFWENNKKKSTELTQLLSNPALDKEFVRIQKKDLVYAQKWSAILYLYNYERQWDQASQSSIYKKKFTPAQRKKLEDFIKNSNLNDEELFIHGPYYKRFLELYLRHNHIDTYKKGDFLSKFHFINKTFKSQMIKEYFFFNEMMFDISWEISPKVHAKNYQFYQKKAKNIDFKNYIKYLYKKVHLKGDQAPDFNYEDVHGKKVKLSDWKGNYVYIFFLYTVPFNSFYRFKWKDFFIKEISYLKKIAKKYENKPIKFIGISMDLDWVDYGIKENWEKIIKKEKLDKISIQLIADKGSYSNFRKHLTPFSPHPQFILLDKEGKILKRRAPSFSCSDEIKELLDKLK